MTGHQRRGPAATDASRGVRRPCHVPERPRARSAPRHALSAPRELRTEAATRAGFPRNSRRSDGPCSWIGSTAACTGRTESFPTTSSLWTRTVESRSKRRGTIRRRCAARSRNCSHAVAAGSSPAVSIARPACSRRWSPAGTPWPVRARAASAISPSPHRPPSDSCISAPSQAAARPGRAPHAPAAATGEAHARRRRGRGGGRDPAAQRSLVLSGVRGQPRAVHAAWLPAF